MNQGIPARDTMIDKNGQITSIWLIFFERLYSLYSDSSANNEDSIAQIKELANQAINLAKQANSTNASQQKEINRLFELITNSTKDFATIQDLDATNKRIEQNEYDIQQLQIALGKLKVALSDAEKDTQNKIEDLQEQISNIARSSFVEAPVDGKTYGRKDLEWSEVIAVSLSLPFFLTNGTQSNIQLTPNYELPFWMSNGTQQNIQMVVT
ncbi:hypothetical protein [Acinetobacter haemolyticus]|uniref:hypothetical protein n=1 Tax=Acinetobacter haemolyticus TaxID=29430 RepID=UPI003008EDA2